MMMTRRRRRRKTREHADKFTSNCRDAGPLHPSASVAPRLLLHLLSLSSMLHPPGAPPSHAASLPPPSLPLSWVVSSLMSLCWLWQHSKICICIKRKPHPSTHTHTHVHTRARTHTLFHHRKFNQQPRTSG